MAVSISIIIPTYNMGRFLTQLVESIAQNTFGDIELIIIDDGSTDNTSAVVKRLQQQGTLKIHYHIRHHRGKAASINYVLENKLAKGAYIIFADADDLLPNRSLQQRYEAILKSGTELVIGGFAVADLYGKPKEERIITDTDCSNELANRFFFEPKTPFHLNSVIMSKALAERTGSFDESLKRGQEVEYAIRLLKESDEISMLTDIVYLYRKYERPMKNRLKMRLRTTYDRCRTINKHLSGTQRIKATTLHMGLDILKLGYELLRPYAR